MKALSSLVACAVLALGCAQSTRTRRGSEDRLAAPVEGTAAAAPSPDRAPPAPLHSLIVDLDLSASRFERWELEMVLGEINRVWAQAGICFSFRDQRLGRSGPAGLRLAFVDADLAGLNGRYEGDRDLWALDGPSLYDAPHPTAHPASRTASHELGHALGLRHYNGRADSSDSLMASGTRGYFLHAFEIDAARSGALDKLRARACGPPELL